MALHFRFEPWVRIGSRDQSLQIVGRAASIAWASRNHAIRLSFLLSAIISSVLKAFPTKQSSRNAVPFSFSGTDLFLFNHFDFLQTAGTPKENGAFEKPT